MKYRRCMAAPRGGPLSNAWKAALTEFRDGLVARKHCTYAERMGKHFRPRYTQAAYLRWNANTGRHTALIRDVWAYLHLCARRGDPFAARAIARVLTQRVKT